MATKKPTTYELDDKGRWVIPKDPDAELDYPFDWTPWLSPLSDTIASVQWLLEGSLELNALSSGHDATTATAWVSGGEGGKLLGITCRITTAAGRIEDRTVFAKIQER